MLFRSLAAGPIEDVFTARTLSRCFGVPLEIERRDDRWRAWATRLWAWTTLGGRWAAERYTKIHG